MERLSSGLASLFEVLTFFGALASGLCLFLAAQSYESAPAMAALSAFGIGLTVIPYCLAGIFHRGALRDRNRRLDLGK